MPSVPTTAEKQALLAALRQHPTARIVADLPDDDLVAILGPAWRDRLNLTVGRPQ